jgi:PPP family 3-phenylpropionic acid transporter
VGVTLAMLPLVGIAAQPLWGQVADRTGSRARVLAWLGIGAVLGYVALYRAEGFPAVAAATAALACFQVPLIPNSVSVTLALTRDAGRHAFGRMRVWGTIGFFALVLAFPPALHALQRARGLARRPAGISEPGLEVMFPTTAVLLLIGALVAFALPREGAVSIRAPRGDWRRLLRHGPFLRLLGFTLVAYLCLQGPMSLFPVYVRAHGGSLDSVSRMWILMLIPEIPFILLSGAGLARFGPRGLLAIGVFAGGLRWIVCGFAPSLAWIYPVQVLHGVVVTGLVIGGPLYVEAAVPERLRSTGQALLAMIGLGIGGACSQLTAGWLLERVGPDAPYVAGGIGALILAAILPIAIPPATRPPAAEGEGPTPPPAV